ncbi:hypothetical protein LINGRAHAP2_LOCUS24881 [Linum grandiflorum]
MRAWVQIPLLTFLFIIVVNTIALVQHWGTKGQANKKTTAKRLLCFGSN